MMNYEKKTIEEKAKAYDKAIGRAKAHYAKGAPDSLYLEEIFPELKESEEEKIIAMLKKVTIGANHGELQMLGDGEAQKCIAWLEKQSERKPVVWSEDDVKNFGDVIAAIWKCYHKTDMAVGLEIWLNSLKSRAQLQGWKPSDEQMKVMEEAIAYFGDCWLSTKQLILEELYKELKKLKEE